MVQAVCFDLDGTLFDDRQYVRAGLRSAAAELEAIADVDLSAEFIDAYFERGITEGTFDTVLAEHDLPGTLVPRLVDAYHDNDGALDTYHGVDETLATLAESYELGLITGGRNGLEKLDTLDIDEYFETVVVTSGEDTSKREPDPFESVCTTLDVPVGSTVYVGDRPNLDFTQPNRLGMYTLRVLQGRFAERDATGDSQPDATVSDVRDIPAVLTDLDC